MKFQPTDLKDAWLILVEPLGDDRGFFARTFCVDEFAKHGLETHYPQHSVSLSSRPGTVRGMHYQREPHSEVKLVRCLKGAIWDVIIDIRRDSPTYRRWQAFELSESNNRQIYIPKGFAHGFQTLSDSAEVNYLISEPYVPDFAVGIRYNDPIFNIGWPLPVTAISERDQQWPDFADRR
jgi:dTDP-4-dehydrorhamnose 3,5-epimerase